MSKLLHIDTDLQIPNRILKDNTNKVKQITDKAQNIAFTQSDSSKQPTYNNDGYYEFDGVGKFLKSNGISDGFDLNDYSWSVLTKVNISSSYSDTIQGIFQTSHPTEYRLGFMLAIRHDIEGGYISVTVERGDALARYNMNYTVSQDVDHELLLIKEGKALYLIIDGVLRDTVSNSSMQLLNATDHNYIIGRDRVATRYFSGRNYFNIVYTYALFHLTDNPNGFQSSYSIGDVIYTKQFEPFNYYHRYKDGEFYLSSKYLKDAVIDVNNEITSIKESMNDGVVTILNGVITLDKGGFYFDGASKLWQNEGSYLVSNTEQPSAWFIGFWVKPENVLNEIYATIGTYSNPTGNTGASDYMAIRGDYITANKVNFFFQASGEGLFSCPDPLVVSSYGFIAAQFITDTIYFFINGVLQGSMPISGYRNNRYMRLVIGGRATQNSNPFTGWQDDHYFKKAKLIDPTGYAIGRKVFEPPRRGGFNSEIKQY